MVRIFSGTLRTDDIVHVAGHRDVFTGSEDSAHPGHDEDEKIGPLSFPVGVEMKQKNAAIAGDIVLVSKLTRAETSDTLSAKDRPALVEPWQQPEPLLPVALTRPAATTTTSSPGPWRDSSSRTPPCTSSAPPKPTNYCCGRWDRPTPTCC